MDHTWNERFTNIDLRRRMITYEKVNEREIIDHHRTAKERKSPMTIHSKFLAMSILLMTQHIALAQIDGRYDCGGGVIQSIKNNWNDSVSRISITTDNTIPRASNKYLYEGSVMINTALGTAPYADIIETTLEVGDTVTNEIGEPHQIICLEEGDIFEVSTTHADSDSYRVMKGDSQNVVDCKH